MAAEGVFRAEQDVLLVRLVADSGARRGELAALRVDDLDTWPTTPTGASSNWACSALSPARRRQWRPPRRTHRPADHRPARPVLDIRIRHTVGSYLVGEGKILKAAGRLRHREPSTTLRNYADALPLDDEDAADALDRLYRDPPDPPTPI